ncbi:MAG: signal recognition particle protein [Gammaproteobacteria bacterium]|nr:signal recognition particle protein [Gammaproteobacteria bacterium]MBI5617658.1 signal recognition particle protein [Gammaproteobacteria bacterium]
MFENLSDRLTAVVKKLRGQARLTEENIDATLREVRMALLEADVALPVVRAFMDGVRAKALGQDVIGNLTPGQALIRVVRDELTLLMGESGVGIDYAAQPPVVILLAGLQGSGKTTSAAKLAKRLKENERKSVAVVSCDVYRPAAIEQLRVLAEEIGVEFYPSAANAKPRDIALSALDQARRQFKDVLIVDTAGRLHIDDEMMQEIKDLHTALNPKETLFVIDSMMGQDAVNTARAFNEALPLSGVVLTKTDGDARGGAALSVRHVTGKPIKFIGVGEKTHALEPFHPDRMASRILGMGDVLTLIEEVEQKVDKEKAAKVAEKLSKGKGFDLLDFREQLDQMKNMGGLAALMGKLPGTAELPDHVKSRVNDKELTRLAAIIDSMTPQERRFPAIIKASRKRRIATGSGTQVQDINRLLKQFDQMQKMMKKVSKKGGLKNLIRGMKGQMPPRMPF